MTEILDMPVKILTTLEEIQVAMVKKEAIAEDMVKPIPTAITKLITYRIKCLKQRLMIIILGSSCPHLFNRQPKQLLLSITLQESNLAIWLLRRVTL